MFTTIEGPVLDIGAGSCWLYGFLQIEDYFGIDSIRSRPDMSRESLTHINFVQGLAEYLPFRSNCFSIVLFIASLQHVINPAAAFDQAARVLKPGGQIVIMSGHHGKIHHKLFRILRLITDGDFREVIHAVGRNIFRIGQCERRSVTDTMVEMLSQQFRIDKVYRDNVHISKRSQGVESEAVFK
jgi:ubiquinone/menaquinone biosynthesis C-methylase UbiE